MIEQLAPIWKPPTLEAIVALHEVVDPPFELQSTAEGTLLVEMTQDYVRKASVNDVMILADIQISDPRSRMQGIKLRKTLWAREAMTRAQVLQMFSADSLCNEGAIDCTLCGLILTRQSVSLTMGTSSISWSAVSICTLCKMSTGACVNWKLQPHRGISITDHLPRKQAHQL